MGPPAQTEGQTPSYILGIIPFIPPQMMFQGTRTVVPNGAGVLASMTFASASTDVTVKHGLGHPIQLFWPAFTSAGKFLPKLMISTTSASNTGEQVILQADTASGVTTVVLFG